MKEYPQNNTSKSLEIMSVHLLRMKEVIKIRRVIMIITITVTIFNATDRMKN